MSDAAAQASGSVGTRSARRPGSATAIPGAALGALGLLALVALWWGAIEVFSAPGSFARLFSPSATFSSLIELASGPDLWTHVALSLKRIAVGLGLAVLIGVPIGLAVGASTAFEAATTPAFQLLRMISPLSWMPIAVMMLGVGDKPIYFLLTFAAVWPILLNTAAGVRALDRRWLLLAESLSATRWELLTRVIVPGVVSHVLTGVRLAIGVLWIVLVPCEMLGVSAGLGYFILDTRDRLAYSELGAVVIVIGVLGFLLDAAARAAHRAWLAGSA